MNSLFSQDSNLQFGAYAEFKDEFFFKPKASVKYLEFHSLSVNGVFRVSGNRFGLESSLGFEKSIGKFLRNSDNSFSFNYLNLDRMSISIMPFVYLIKKEKYKLDLGFGMRHYMNISKKIDSPIPTKVSLLKYSAKGALNYTVKNFQFGIFGEFDVVTDYAILIKPFSFGFRFGYLSL